MTSLHVAAFLSAALGVASGAYGYVCARRAARDRAAAAQTRRDVMAQWRVRGEARREARRIEG